jgi:nucleoside-diphosphate-sugar epimerase
VQVVLLALREGHVVRGIDIHVGSTQRKGLAVKDTDEDEYAWIERHPNYMAITTDVTNYHKTRDALAGVDAVIQLAGMPWPGDGVFEAHNTNVVISYNIFRAAAELGIHRVAAASSVNAIGLVFNRERHFDYLPLDEQHPCRPDEPYGLSKQSVLIWLCQHDMLNCEIRILEMQADAMCRRYPHMRIASLRLSWSVPERETAQGKGGDRSTDLWGYVQRDSGASAFLLAIAEPSSLPTGWKAGHEAFFIVSPHSSSDTSFEEMHWRAYPSVPIKTLPSERAWTGFFDCSKAERILGWTHRD